MPTSRLVKLAAIGTAGGLFSGLFGVGGGSVLVPLLLFWLAFDIQRATGTSLMAIGVIATIAGGMHAGYGNVAWGDAMLIGLPAVGGVVAGTWLQQRLPTAAVSLLFSVLLVVVAVDLIVK